MLQDINLVCKDCGNDFIFSVAEQEFFNKKGFDEQPKRCVSCRRKKRQKAQQRNQREDQL